MKMFAVDDFVAREGKHVFFPLHVEERKVKIASNF